MYVIPLFKSGSLLNCPQLTAVLRDREHFIQTKRVEFRSKEEELTGGIKELEKEIVQLRKKRKMETSQGKTDHESEKLANLEVCLSTLTNHETYGRMQQALINCSTCREDNAFRSTIITKCMHSTSIKSLMRRLWFQSYVPAFCKSCVDARLATRQRKCPACNLAFGQSDVHTFFFQ